MTTPQLKKSKLDFKISLSCKLVDIGSEFINLSEEESPFRLKGTDYIPQKYTEFQRIIE